MPLQRARWLVLTPETWRDDLLRIVLRVIAWFGGAVCLPSVFFALRLGKTGLATLDTVAITAVFALAYFRRIPERLRAAGTGLVMYALGAGLMIEVGPISQIYLFGFSLLTALLLGARWGLATVVLNASTMIVIGYAGFAAPTMVAAQGKWSSGEWAVVTGNFVFVNASLVVAMGLVIDALETALGRAVAARAALEHEQRELVKLNESLAQEMRERVRSDDSRMLVEARHSKLEEQFRQAQKMETVGSLAGGVAHDFNNLMSIVLSYSEMLAEGLKIDDPMLADLHEIRDAGLRAVELTRQLLAFSRQQVLAPKIVDLGGIVGGMEKMLRRLIGDQVDLCTSCASGLGKIRVDPGQIEQVIMNLAVNARDAMPLGGMLTIETASVALDEAYASEHVGVSAGPHVMLAVSDTGTGMDAATQARMFEPFFTTKEKGKGTGLGLATVFGIVSQSGGTVWAYSELGKGTAFKVYFPLADGAAAADALAAAPGDRGTLRGSETVLLVEDDERVRVLTRTILRKYGYNVLDAQNGGEAFLLCEQHTAPIHLLLTDVVMLRMSGRQLAERLLTIRPDMRVLYMSGYTNDAVVRHGILDSTIAFIQKPITPEALARKVREVFDVPRRALN